MSEIKKTSEIKFTVKLDEGHLPLDIGWYASDAGFAENKSCKALLISLFDTSEKTTMKIDLWTKDMLVDEMNQFFAETFMALADTYESATGEKEAAEIIKKFAGEFAKITGLGADNN